MGYNTQKLLTDIDGRPIPQYYDPVTDMFYPAGTMPVRLGANTPLVTTHQNAATANGNGVAADVDGYGSAMFQVTGTFNAKVNFEGSVDGVNYVPIFVLDSSGNRVASATAPGIFRADIAGLKSIRAPISNYVSGAVTVVSRALPMARPTEQSVLLNGSNVQPTMRQIAVGELAANGGAYSDTQQNLLTAPGIQAVGYVLYSAQPLEFQMSIYDENNNATIMLLFVAEGGRMTAIPPFRPLGTRYTIVLRNRGSAPATPVVRELRYASIMPQPQNLRALMAKNLAIRDTSTHNYTTDPNNIFILNRQIFGGGKVPIYVNNGFDQAVSVGISLVIDGQYSAVLGTVSVPASSKRVITNQDFAGIDVPSERIDLSFTCSVAPTSGTLQAHIDTLVGGGA